MHKKPMAVDMNEWILEANPAPMKKSSLRDVVRSNQFKKFSNQQFARIQAKIGMNYYTLRFHDEYESAYLRATEASSVVRVRLVFLCGFLLRASFLAYDHLFKATPPDGNDAASKWILVLDFGISLPAFLLAYLLTYLRCVHRTIGVEGLTAAVFSLVAWVLIVKKPLEQEKGPVLELVLLLIPIFGITRMRFITSVVLGTSIVLVYLGVQLVAAYYLPGCDAPNVVMYQTFNYGIRVFGGVVSHYRQELLRRRNHALRLPIPGLIEGDTYMRLSWKFSDRALLHRGHLAFRDSRVEGAFYPFWYLIDPCPYDNIFNFVLHHRVFRALRLPLMNVVLSQLLLAYQDSKVLESYPTTQRVAYVARLAIVIPAYLCMVALIALLARFYAHRLQFLQLTSSSKESFHPLDRGYVAYAQTLAGIVVVIHVAAMAILVLAVFASDATLSDLYFMGLLNSLLFVHRSGLRVRFVYATVTSATSVVGFVVAVASILPTSLAVKYAMYTIAVLVLGALTSREEETLRRVFFILRSMRSLQFHEWFAAVSRLRPWIRTKLRRRLRDLRDRWRPSSHQDHDEEDGMLHVSAGLAGATAVGIYSQVFEAIASVV
ncbi:Aste57867_4362 [Aphanomyces stellatus]|uniref:Aste57867_4362 protein n=1 Tax=Aphanomyces stellatus TaxID=120398 RepID=A0A485KCZ5_9STRA|nr:hypothetical protein As57867_004350 [Aphanomyces stellatus]VFT81476.1 Aste57867_4362 [Aphanomyces stellatus]